MTPRRATAFGGLLAAVAAPLIALSTSAIAAAEPDFDPEALDATETWGTPQPPFTPGLTYAVGDTKDALYPALGDTGTFQALYTTLGSTTGTDLVSINWSDRFTDYINGQSNGDTIVTDYSDLAGWSQATGTFTADLGGNLFYETLNSAGNLVEVGDNVDLFGNVVTLFDFTL